MNYQKYQKYKNKHLKLLKQIGGEGSVAGSVAGPIAGPYEGPGQEQLQQQQLQRQQQQLQRQQQQLQMQQVQEKPLLALQSSEIRDERLKKEQYSKDKRAFDKELIKRRILEAQKIHEFNEKEKRLKEEMSGIVVTRIESEEIDIEDSLDYKENLIILKNIIPVPPSTDKYFEIVLSKFKLSSGIFNKLLVSPYENCRKDSNLHKIRNLIPEENYDELFTNKLSGLEMIKIFKLI